MENIADEVLKGNRLALAKAITAIENEREKAIACYYKGIPVKTKRKYKR